MSVRNSRDVRNEKIAAGEVIRNGEVPEEWNESKEHEAREADQDKARKEREQKLLLQGKSIVQYDERAIDDSKNLLGIRWLSRTCGALVIAPSGHGKSSFAIQFAILISCARIAFGIRPVGPLRVLIIQAEDDDNDLTEMSAMVRRLDLSQAERDAVAANTLCLWINDATGRAFISLVDDALSAFPADVLIINPLSAYVGKDLKDEEAVHEFFRTLLTPVLKARNCGLLGIHHTPKTNFRNTENFNWYDWMYSGAGNAGLTNWARAVLVIAPSSTPGTYRFIAAKRFEKTGWQSREYWYSHSIENGVILWVPSTQDQIAIGHKGRDATCEDLLTIVPMLDPVPIESLIVKAKKDLGMARDKVRDFLKVLVHEGKVFQHFLKRARTNDEVKYSRTP
jgi:AAA domain